MFLEKKLVRKIALKGHSGTPYSEALMDQRSKDESCERQRLEAIDKVSLDSKVMNKAIV